VITTFSRSFFIVVSLGLVVGACSNASTSSNDQATVTTQQASATPTDPAATAPPTSTAAKEDLDQGEPATETVSILVDADGAETQEVSVALGTPMTIRARSSVSDEFHLHGYELKLTGTDVTFNFVADKLGEFELETHDSGRLLLMLIVLED
jgi:hypothetical protein